MGIKGSILRGHPKDERQEDDEFVTSLLDTDLYKLTMQQAVLQKFPTTRVTYKYKNRSLGMMFNKECVAVVEKAVKGMEKIELQPEEAEWIRLKCPFLSDTYLEYLSTFRFRPAEQVRIAFKPSGKPDGSGHLDIEVHGLWVETILYEVPLMAILNQAYFQCVDTDWSYEGQSARAYDKGAKLYSAGIVLSEFGTRRRRSRKSQELVLQALVKAHDERGSASGMLFGTSNVKFAMQYGLKPIGTIAHEWFMGIAAISGYETITKTALQHWEDVYPPDTQKGMLIALTDTFTTPVFFKQLEDSPEVIKRWKGLRQDSGDPLQFMERVHTAFKKHNIDPGSKVVTYSDALDVDKCIKIKQENDKYGFIASFGVGTSLTNDYDHLLGKGKSKALNIVVKIDSVEGIPCLKLSDDVEKITGGDDTLLSVKSRLGLDL